MNPACPPTGHGVTCPAVRFQRVSFAYGAGRPFVLRNLDLDIAEGEMLLVAGPSGCGKSTLLRCVNGLVPHFSGGQFGGSVVVDGLSTRDHPPRELADRVGFVFQDPDAQFVVETVEDELAFAMENLRLP
ncbi:MAG: ABC transporter ATP-binding protein, partial [Actinomycetota bacterium]